MNNSKQSLTCAQARKIDIVDWLAGKGHYPYKIRMYNYWYLSPLRLEKAASFKVNRKLNCWHDYGFGKGGNLVDLGILYHNCTITELLQIVHGDFSFHRPIYSQPKQLLTENSIQILGDFGLSSFTLLRYLEQRCIPYKIVNRFCREVRYLTSGKIYYSIGFRNDAGGFELRNQYVKNSSSPKSIITIKNGARKIAVFEGFFDFLSSMVLVQGEHHAEWDFCILNSLSFFEKSTPFLTSYESIHLFLDNDKAGQNCSIEALKYGPKYIDESGLYQNYKDLNEWMMTMGKSHKPWTPRLQP